MFKLGLFQVGEDWNWYLQQVIPVDMPFTEDRSVAFGQSDSLSDAIIAAKEQIKRRGIAAIGYVYLDRQNSGLVVS